MGYITAERFEKAVGRKPVIDDLDRCNCDKGGRIGHYMCGWCKKCNKPIFICGHTKRK